VVRARGGCEREGWGGGVGLRVGGATLRWREGDLDSGIKKWRIRERKKYNVAWCPTRLLVQSAIRTR